jgi:hypothetical protein
MGTHQQASVMDPGPAPADPLLRAAQTRTAALPRAVSSKLAAWAPQLEQRALSQRDWDAWSPLVRAAVVCAAPRNASVASDLLGTAVSLMAFAHKRRMPLRAELVFRASTGDAFLATLTSTSVPTVASRVRSLVAGVEQALADPAPQPAGQNAGEATETLQESGELEPLLLDVSAPTARELTQAGLAGPAAAQVLRALAAVRSRVLAVEPAALLRQEPFRGRGRSVPYGDREVVALLATAGAQRSTKRRIHAAAAICLGVGAGITGEAAARVRGTDVRSDRTDAGQLVLVGVEGRQVPLHAAFAGPVLFAASVAGDGWVLGGGPAGRADRMSQLAAGLEGADAHLVRMNSARLRATWLAMHATLGVPLGDLVDAAGWSSAEPLTAVLPYLPRSTPTGLTALAGLAGRAVAVEKATVVEEAAVVEEVPA